MCTCKKKQSQRLSGGIGARMQAHELDKKAMLERMRMLKQDRARSRDEKYAGRAGPADVQEPAPAVLPAQPQPAQSPTAQSKERRWSVVCKRGSDASIGDWHMVGRDDLHSPHSCRPPCTSHTPARCTVS